MSQYRGPRLVVLCVDGGLPSVVGTWNFFSPHRRLPDSHDSGATALRSVFPSSTAPAHASFLTGAHPTEHGVIGNRYWTGEPVAEICRRAANPLLTLHPYDAASLTAPSLVEWLADQGARVAAVHFPQTFSQIAPSRAVSSLYCLYAPARRVLVPLADGTDRETVQAVYFDESLPLTARVPSGGGAQTVMFSIGTAGPETAVPVAGRTVQVDARITEGNLSVPVRCEKVAHGTAELVLGTAVLTLSFGAVAARDLRFPGCGGPSSLGIEYTANPEHDFHESPSAPWIRDSALDIVAKDEPDVLFLRFNQADHAQEFLYWYAARSGGREAALAREQILSSYQTIDACVGDIMREVGDQADYVLFSDHGIDYVETHLQPNVVLRELGLDTGMIFQGDSNIAYLYADRPVSQTDRRRIINALAAVDTTVRPADAVSHAVRLPSAPGRTGELLITCGPHREFDYGFSGPAGVAVRSASHGYFPSYPAMNGFFRMFGPRTAGHEAPGAITDVADLVKNLWLRGQ
ncbi:type I phosphodiesterase/nucleotide pyrophosphatase [Streptomyces sp. BK022]|uniref:alkaline phosphatase family protein n=1 Tax=Streptomyces sp. BK022 TaxID=2512123 RepID=UPI00102A3100|nr:alkaline phosphatase family protein [Streptomyces sp. BK022]RZU45738.1 type I phosphodiesterase/nucleotide pyrophosphatase [Streptomyces sp. BK022]